jgi:P4 family phage/plasmid primase-like protien
MGTEINGGGETTEINMDELTQTRVEETRSGITRGWKYTPLTSAPSGADHEDCIDNPWGKRPYLQRWNKRNDSTQQMLQWAEWRNVGLITGLPSGIDVIDLDGEAAGRIDEFPETVTVITGGGGRHLYYQHDPDANLKNWVGQLGKHIDVRTTGGQVVAVGGLTQDVYRWMPGRSPDEIDFAPLPVELLEKMYAELHAEPATPPQPQPRRSTTPRRGYVTAALDNETTAVASAAKGTRNATLNRSAFNLGQLVANGDLAEADAEQALTAAASGWLGDDFTNHEMQTTIRSGIAGGKRHPRTKNRLPSERASHTGAPQDDYSEGEPIIDIPEGYEPNPAHPDPATPATPQAPAPAPSPAPRTVAKPTGHHIDPFGAGNTGESIRLGDCNHTGRIMLSPKKTLPTAQAYIKFHYSHPDHDTIVFCGGVFYLWHQDRNCWREVEPKYLERNLGRWLHEALRYHRTPQGNSIPVPFESNPRSVADAINTLKGETFIAQDTPLPSWLRGTSGNNAPRPLSECIAFKSATLHIPTGETYQPTPCHWIQNALEFDYNENAPHPVLWLAFLQAVLGGDAEQITLLQEWFGYCLTTDTRHHKIFLFQGPPRCGKGTASRILERLVGLSNVCNPSVQELAENYGLQSFVGKSLAIFGDAKWTTREAAMAVEKLLRVSGGDGVNVRRMYLPSLTNVKLPTRIMLLANDMPEFYDASGAMANRFLIIRSFVSYLGREDTTLEARLAEELPGILLWAIDGWKSLRANGRFTVPAIMAREIAELQESASPTMKFVTECCELGDDKTATADELWKTWGEWCEKQGLEPGSRARLGRQLKSAVPGVERNQKHIDRYYQGISIRGNLF